jgi:hypothetical protein
MHLVYRPLVDENSLGGRVGHCPGLQPLPEASPDRLSYVQYITMTTYHVSVGLLYAGLRLRDYRTRQLSPCYDFG